MERFGKSGGEKKEPMDSTAPSLVVAALRAAIKCGGEEQLEAQLDNHSAWNLVSAAIKRRILFVTLFLLQVSDPVEFATAAQLAARGVCLQRPEAMPGLFAFLSTFLQGNYEVGPLFFCFICSHTLAVSRVSELLLPPCLLRWCLTLLAKTRFFVFVFLFCFVDRKQLQVVGGLDQHSARRFDRQWLADFVLARTCKYCGSW